MRRFLAFLLLLSFLYLLGSLFMPTQLIVKKEVTVENNKKIVYNVIQDLKTIQGWSNQDSEKRISLGVDKLYFELWDKEYHFYIKKNTPNDSLVLVAQNVDNKKKIFISYALEDVGETLTNIHLKVEFSEELLPSARYTYGLDKDKIEDAIESLLNHIKNVSEQIDYERYTLSPSRIGLRDDLVFAVPHRTEMSSIMEAKKQEIDSLLLARLSRYRLLDTTKVKFIQYSDWTDSLIQFNVCIPILRTPSPKQLLWLRGGRVDSVTGQYYSATYTGTPQDLSLAWDSLYSRLHASNNVAEGLPLEELLRKTDSTETRKLFIRLR
ncbi:hypothetical protein C7377_1221 [Balneicella halophila]|uniref:Uncharacterized protein n=1 Tax=Balneicella halophila TaxID=1537566 RepID=A0A7L4UP55_BALHA|nr:hypothetical protein [Balneicella halophila]PVX50898.1 hypothetical protein C7377_1221 [Balneicella halophila]